MMFHLAGSKSHHVWDLGGKSLAWMYHLKAVISEISGEKTDNPTDNHLLKFRARKGRRHISSILTSPKPVLSMPTLHSATSTSKFIASSRSRPTAWWPGSYVVNVTQRNRPARCPNHFFAVNEPSAAPCFQYHKRRFHPPSYQQSP